MTVVLDTNVVMSGIFWSGPPYEILKAWHAKKFKIAVSMDRGQDRRSLGRKL